MYDGNRGPRRTSQLWLHDRILELRADVRRLSLHHNLSYLINAEVPCGSYQGRGGKNRIFGVRWTRVWVSVVWTPACSPNLRVFVYKIEVALPASHDGGGQRGKRSAVCVACYYLSLTQISLLPSGSCNVLSQGPRGCARAGCLSQLSSRTLDGSPPPSLGRRSCSHCLSGSGHLTCSSSNVRPLGMSRGRASVSPRLGHKQQEGLAGEGRLGSLRTPAGWPEGRRPSSIPGHGLSPLSLLSSVWTERDSLSS